MPLTHNLYPDHPHNQELYEISPDRVRRHDGSEDELVNMKEYHKQKE